MLGIHVALGADTDAPTPRTIPYQAKVAAADSQPIPGAIAAPQGKPAAKGADGGDTEITRRPGATPELSPEAAASARAKVSSLVSRLFEQFGGAAGNAGTKSRLVGSVLDPEGKPAPHALVSLFPYSQGEKSTDAEGRFTLFANPDQFGGMQNVQRVVMARDLARDLAAALDIDEDATNAPLKLEPGLTLAGRVTDASGKPIPKAEIRLIFMTERMGNLLGQPAHTDAEGRFEINALPSGRRYSVNVMAYGYGSDNRFVEAGDAATRRIDLEPFQLALADRRIAGVVVDDEDKPVKGAMISTSGNGQPSLNGQTDANGRFSFGHVCAGPINVYANSQRGNGFGNGSTLTEGGDTNITVKLGMNQPMGGMASARVKVTGTIQAPDGQPAPKVVVSLLPYSQAEKRTDTEGRYTLSVDPNEISGMQNVQRVVIARDLAHNWAAALDIDEDTTNAPLKLEPSLTLVGRVTDAKGNGIPRADVHLIIMSERQGNSFGQPAVTDAEGRFEIKALPPGRRYSVSAMAKGYGNDNRMVEAGDAATRRMDVETLQLPLADQRIAGVVVDEEDKPVKGARVNINGNGQPSLNGQTDAKGQFSFDRVCAGPINIYANSQRGNAFGNGNAVAEGGDTNITVKLGVNQPMGDMASARVKVTGTIQAPDGTPAPKVTVSLLPYSQTEKRTDAEGRFTLSANPNEYGGMQQFQRVVIARDLAHNWAAALDIDEDCTNALLKLEPGLTLAGQVTDAKGNGIPKADVHLIFMTERMGGMLGQPAHTDADGRFEIRGLPTGRRYSVNVMANGYGNDNRMVEASDAATRRIDLEPFQLALADRRIAGVVVDDEDKPVRGAMINTYGSGQPNLNAQTDAKGRFSFDRVCAGPITIYANNQRGNAYGNGSTVAEGGDTNITVKLGVNQPMGDMASARVKVTGTIQAPDGQPAPKVVVTLFPFSNQEDEKRTDAQGRFTLTANPNQFGGGQEVQRVVIARDLSHNWATALDIDEDTTNAPLKLEPGLSIAGRVTDASGKPIPKAEAHLVFMTERMSNSLGQPARADADGRFEIKGLPAGRRYSVNVIANGYGNDSRMVEASDAATRRIDLDPFQLALADRRIAGVVVDEEDKPVKGAMVNTHGNGQPGLNGQTDAKGRFSFDHVCAGPINVYAYSQRGLGHGSTVAEGGDTNITVTLGVNQRPGGMAKARAKVTGTIQTPDGQPASKVIVSLFPYSQSEKRTDAEGRFTLTADPNQFGGMENVQRVVIARDLGHNWATALDIEEDTTNAPLKLEPGLTLAGRVTDAKGNGISKAEVNLIFMTVRRGSSLGQPTRVDAEGRFEIKALPPGRRYSINVVANGYGTDNRQVEPSDPALRQIDLDPFPLNVADQRIAGVVVDDDDKPVRGANIYTYGAGQPNVNGQTDTKGRFSFDHVCAGLINVSANSPRGNAYGNTVAEGGDTNITVKMGVTQTMGGTARAGSRVTGTVQDADGKPAPRVLVSLFPFAPNEKTTDAEGRFKLTWDLNQFGGPPLNQRVLIARDLGRNLAASLDLDEGVTNADLKLEPAWTLAGRAVDTNGAAIPGAQAQLMFKTDRMTSSFGSTTRADAEGRFEIRGLSAGRAFSVQISAKGFGRDTLNAEPPEGDSRRVDLDATQLLAADQQIGGVVIDADDKPVRGAYINTSGNKQPNLNSQTDSKGRFSFKQVCVGPLRLYVNNQNGGFANAAVEGGDTNITIRIVAPGGTRAQAAPPASLQGKPLPDLLPLGLTAEDVPANQRVLALLIDAEQRPSRRVLKRMTELAGALKEKGVAVVVLQAGAMEGDAFATWKQEAALPFPVGLLKGNRDKTRAAWGAAALPWLILTDTQRQVTDEGFAPGELEEKLKSTDK